MDLRKKVFVVIIALTVEAAKRLGLIPYGAEDVWAASRRAEQHFALLPEAAREQVNNLWDQLWDYITAYLLELFGAILNYLEY